MKFREELVHQINEEFDYQNSENEKGNESYQKASAYHTQIVSGFKSLAQEYPHFIDRLLEKHIEFEEAIFNTEEIEDDLTPEEKGRVYSLVRCKHMIRVAKEACEKN